jgi:hypothetical protein
MHVVKVCRLLTVIAATTWVPSGISFGQSNSSGAPPAILVGAVNGTPIWYPGYSEETIADIFFLRYSKAPDPISDREKTEEIRLGTKCNVLDKGIFAAAMEAAKARFSISATREELEAARTASLRDFDAEAIAARTRAFNAPIAAALDEVYEQGADPGETFKKHKDELGIPEEQWKIHVYMGRMPAYRARLRRATTVTADDAAKPMADTRPIVEREKLRAAIDREIGLTDPAFRASAQIDEEAKKQKPSGMPMADFQRLKAGRAEWWTRFYSTLRVEIYDATLRDACKIDPATWQ